MMTTIERRKARLRVVLIAAVALGTSSATLGGALSALLIQQPIAAATA